MTSLKNKIVFVTGATSGIGHASALAFAAKGTKLILAARRTDRLKAFAKGLKLKNNTETFLITLDVRKQKDVAAAVKSLPAKWQNIDVLVNNAGLSRGLDKLHEASIKDWDEMLDTNVKGLLYVSRAVIPLMVKRNTGHIINIGSIAGHEVYPKGNVYCASKYAVDAITNGMRMDLVDTDVRVTTIDPGMVETEFSIVRFHGDNKKAKAVYTGITPLTPDDVADAVIYAATRPLNVVVADLILLPNKQAAAMVAHRK